MGSVSISEAIETLDNLSVDPSSLGRLRARVARWSCNIDRGPILDMLGHLRAYLDVRDRAEWIVWQVDRINTRGVRGRPSLEDFDHAIEALTTARDRLYPGSE